MKTFNWIMNLLLVSSCFVGCSDEDNGKIDFTGSSDKKIAKVTLNILGVQNPCREFTYANGKVTACLNVSNNLYFTTDSIFIGETDNMFYKISYPAKNVVIISYSYPDAPYLYEKKYLLNEKGYADSCLYSLRRSQDQEVEVYARCHYEYTAEGFLSKWRIVNEDNSYYMKISYENDNVVSYIYETVKEGAVSQNIYTCIYTSYLNKDGVLPETTYCITWVGSDEIAYYTGIMGRPTHNLLASISNDSRHMEELFQYEFTKEGSINRVGKAIDYGIKSPFVYYNYEYITPSR